MSDSYHSDFKNISKGMLMKFKSSREDYWHYYIGKDLPIPGPGDSVTMGDCVHKILLDKKEVHEVAIRYPLDCYKSNGSLNGQRAAAFRREFSGFHVLRDPDFLVLENILAAVADHPISQLLSHPDAEFEQPIYWIDGETNLPCKAKPDFLLDCGDYVRCIDLKLTGSIYPRDFERIAKRLGYWLQDAHYSSGLETILGKPVQFTFWCIEDHRPHRLSPREYNPRSREVAMDAYRSLMSQLEQCYRTNNWKDPWTTETDLMNLGPWDVDLPEQELEGFEDEQVA